MVTLETERLVMRMFRESDLDAYAAMCADPDVMHFLGLGQTFTRAEAWRNMALMIGHWQLRGYGMWGVEDRVSRELVGRVGCWRPEGWPEMEVGWTLRKQYWGRGYATEAARAAIDWAFNMLGRPTVISLIHPDNAASIGVALRVGEQLDGQTELFGRPAMIYRLQRGDWQNS